MLADRKNYQPGDSARLIVRGETIVGPVLVTKEGQHVSWYRVLRPTPTDAIEVPIDEGDVGDVFVSIAYLREGRLYRAERRLGVPATVANACRLRSPPIRRCRGRASPACST